MLRAASLHRKAISMPHIYILYIYCCAFCILSNSGHLTPDIVTVSRQLHILLHHYN